MLNDASHRIIADLLKARTGQHLSENRAWRVSSALSGIFRKREIGSLDALVCLLADAREDTLANEVVEALLNNETYFFRDHAYFATLGKHVLPSLAEARQSSKRLSIWSAGCSTGQEALSLAMMFAENKSLWDGWEIEILGTDISTKAIATAQGGLYSQFEIQRGISVAQMLRFFDETEAGWQARENIHSMVTFRHHNVLGPPPSPRSFDLVLCRNVLLYFDDSTRERALERLREATDAEGWLMLGAGESISGQSDSFAPADLGASLYNSVRHGGLTSRIPAFSRTG